MSDHLDILMERAEGACELCRATEDLRVHSVPPFTDEDGDEGTCALICPTCEAQLDPDAELDDKHWFGLQESIWSEFPPVQVLSWRMLQRLQDHTWAQDLLAQAYLDEPVLEWAKDTGLDDSLDLPPAFDSNGSPLADGDAVTLIKDLDVKGAGFTAKRGTLVKNIRLGDDPTHIEGRVNGVAIFLKTEFLKKA